MLCLEEPLGKAPPPSLIPPPTSPGSRHQPEWSPAVGHPGRCVSPGAAIAAHLLRLGLVLPYLDSLQLPGKQGVHVPHFPKGKPRHTEGRRTYLLLYLANTGVQPVRPERRFFSVSLLRKLHFLRSLHPLVGGKNWVTNRPGLLGWRRFPGRRTFSFKTGRVLGKLTQVGHPRHE